MQQRWVRFEHAGQIAFGTLEDERVRQYRGDFFGASEPTGAEFALSDVRLLTPTEPSKVIALWNNFHALGEKLKLIQAIRADRIKTGQPASDIVVIDAKPKASASKRK